MCAMDMLATQLLELSKQLGNSSKSFRLSLKTKDINFLFFFLIKKLEEPTISSKSSEETNISLAADTAVCASFKCDQCDRTFDTTKGLKVHIGRSHKDETEPEVLRDTVADNSLELSEVNESREEDNSSSMANSTHLDDFEEVVEVKISSMAEILPAGSEPPPKNLHASMGREIDHKIQPPDYWGGIMVTYKFKEYEAEVYQIIMHPPRGPKGRGVAPIGATQGVH